MGHRGCLPRGPARGHVFERKGVDQHLQVRSATHVLFQIFEEAVVAPFKAREAHGGEIAQLVEEIERHLAVEDSHVGQVLFQPVAAPQGPVQRRALLGAHQADEIVDQPEVGDEISLHSEQAAQQGCRST